MPTNADRRQRVLQLVPEGLPVTRRWLIAQDAELDRHAIDNLIKSRQLDVLAPGVYARPATSIQWESLVLFLQQILGRELYVGGLTALEMQGFVQYLSLSDKRTIHLYGKDPLPHWLPDILPRVRFHKHPALRSLGTEGLTSRTRAQNAPSDEQAFLISTVERAYLELLMDVPDVISFEHADQLLQGMTSLSPRRLEALLRACKNIKVRRLFYWLAERHSHAWLSRLPKPEDLDDLGLGSGNRMLARKGKLDTKYLITVPEDMWTPTINTTDKSDS